MKGIFVTVAALAASVFAAPSIAEGSIVAREATVTRAEFSVDKRETVAGLTDAIIKATDNIKTISISISKQSHRGRIAT